MTSATRNRLRSRIGTTLIAASMGLAVLVVPFGTGAQEEPDPEPVAVEKDALYARSAGTAAPNTLTSQFPPGVICLVEPRFCTQQAEEITGPVNQGLQGIDVDDDGEKDTPPAEDTPDDQSPQQFRAPNTITVAQNSGEDRYASGLKFELPEVPADHEVLSASLVLHEVNPTYHTSSPFFRQMMLAMLAGVRDQEAAQEEAEKAIMNENGQYPAQEREVGNVGVEVCPFTEAFEGGSHDWEAAPGFDCIFGSNGVREETDGGFIWTFDLSFTIAAWQDGTLENHGLYVRPTRAPNLAFGDPDTSWQAQISFGSAGHETPPEVALTTMKAASGGESSFPPPPPANDTSSGSGTTAPPSRQGDFFTPPQTFPDNGGSAPVAEPAPDVAGQPAPAPVAAGNQQLASSPTTPWWVWLLVPTFALGMLMVSQSLTAGVESAIVREGAMTRLIRQRGGGELGTSTPQFQV